MLNSNNILAKTRWIDSDFTARKLKRVPDDDGSVATETCLQAHPGYLKHLSGVAAATSAQSGAVVLLSVPVLLAVLKLHPFFCFAGERAPGDAGGGAEEGR